MGDIHETNGLQMPVITTDCVVQAVLSSSRKIAMYTDGFLFVLLGMKKANNLCYLIMHVLYGSVEMWNSLFGDSTVGTKANMIVKHI